MTRFECNQQGCCCRGWTIPFTPSDVLRLARHLPPEEQERLDGARILNPAAEKDEQRVVLTPSGEDQLCRFLEAAGGCEVHRRFGPAALPNICVNFPAVPYQAGDHVEMYFSLVCPEVLERVAESESAYTLTRMSDTSGTAAAGRDVRATARRSVKLHDVSVPWESLAAIRTVLIDVVNDGSRPVLEAVADISFALGRIRSHEDLERFQVPEVVDRQPFYDFFASSVGSHSGRVLGASLREYRRFLFDIEKGWGPGLEQGLTDWQPAYRRWVLPTIPEWLLRRYLAHRYFTVFSSGAGRLSFSYGNIVHSFALSCRLMAGLCSALQRPVDVPIAKAALGGAEYLHRQLEANLPPEALPWFQPDQA